MHDVTLIDGGSLIGLKAETPEAQQWMDNNVLSEEWSYLGSVLYVDHRNAVRIIDGMEDYGLIISA